MRHQKSGRKFSRTSAHRQAMFENMAASLIKHELIRTTLPKAKELRRVAEPLITLAKTDGVANRRLAFARLRDKEAVGTLFTVLGPRYQRAPGWLPAHPQVRFPRWRQCADGVRRTGRSPGGGNCCRRGLSRSAVCLNETPAMCRGFCLCGKASFDAGSVRARDVPGGSSRRGFSIAPRVLSWRMNPNPFRWSFRAQCLLGFLAARRSSASRLYMERFGGLSHARCASSSASPSSSSGWCSWWLACMHHAARAAGVATACWRWLRPASASPSPAAMSGCTHLPPDQVPACGPDLAYMMDAFPLGDVVRKVLTGSGECAKVDWTLLGMSMPEWSLLWFVVLALWALYAAFKRVEEALLAWAHADPEVAAGR